MLLRSAALSQGSVVVLCVVLVRMLQWLNVSCKLTKNTTKSEDVALRAVCKRESIEYTPLLSLPCAIARRTCNDPETVLKLLKRPVTTLCKYVNRLVEDASMNPKCAG